MKRRSSSKGRKEADPNLKEADDFHLGENSRKVSGSSTGGSSSDVLPQPDDLLLQRGPPSIEQTSSVSRVPQFPSQPPSFAANGGLTVKKKDEDEKAGVKTNYGVRYLDWAQQYEQRMKKAPPTPIVFVKVKFFHVNIDLKLSEADVDFILYLDWIDPSIKGFEKSISKDDDDYVDSYHFSPGVMIHNSIGEASSLAGKNGSRVQKEEEDRDGLIKIPEDGHVKRTARFRAKIRLNNIDASKFPCDKHVIGLQLKGDHIRLKSASSANDKKESPRWRISGDTEHALDNVINEDQDHKEFTNFSFLRDDVKEKGKGDVLVVSLRANRNLNIVVVWNTVIVPLIACNALSISAFYLNPEALGERLSVTVSILVALASFHQ